MSLSICNLSLTVRVRESAYCGPVRVGWYFNLNNLIDLFYRSFFVDSLDLIKMDLDGKPFFPAMSV